MTGEAVPLLQASPSKTDRERLLVVSPEWAEVRAIFRLATRILQGGGEAGRFSAVAG